MKSGKAAICREASDASTDRFRRGSGGSTHGRGEWTQHGKPSPVAWHAPTDSPRGSGRAGRVAERLALPGMPGNAGGGKEPQVRSDAQRDKGLGSGHAYYPE